MRISTNRAYTAWANTWLSRAVSLIAATKFGWYAIDAANAPLPSALVAKRSVNSRAPFPAAPPLA
jgi:hypothetical protein